MKPRSELAKRHLESRATLAVALGAAAIVLIISMFSSSGATKRTLTGTLTVSPLAAQTDPCSTSSALPDLSDGAKIAISDVNGHQVGAGRLGGGRPQGGSCVRTLDIDPLPVLAEYRIVIGGTGPLVVTEDSLQASGGVLDLRFGG
ncbi:MAG: hypothetical protein ABI706_18730 [Ilumatobacteraceae bacterium]